MELVQLMCDNSTITEYIGWKLLDVLLKVIEAIIDTRINKAGNFHEFFHGFSRGEEQVQTSYN